MSDRAAVVTGAARGLGLAIAEVLASRGHRLCLIDRDPLVEEAAAALRASGHDVESGVGDLTKAADVDRLTQRITGLFSEIDVLVNNAGITRDARLAKMTSEDFASVIDVNLLAPMRLTAALRPLLREGASVVNLSSRAALGNFGQTNYVASKSGLVGYTRALALSWAPRVRVNAVAPGLIDSAMTAAMPDDVLSGLVAKVPTQRIGTPLDVARAVAFLASDDASYITGQVLTVCGGRSVAS
jgi:3-oxoacyl-[acyl-carrier protein] reductase